MQSKTCPRGKRRATGGWKEPSSERPTYPDLLEAERRVTTCLPLYLTQKHPKTLPSSIPLRSGLDHGEKNFLARSRRQPLLPRNTGALRSSLERDEWPFVLQPLQKENVITQTGIWPGCNFTLNEYSPPATPLPPESACKSPFKDKNPRIKSSARFGIGPAPL